jgi:hypothetical protein
LHATEVCAPVRANFVDVLWLNVELVQLFVPWQLSHAVGNPPVLCAGLVVPL